MHVDSDMATDGSRIDITTLLRQRTEGQDDALGRLPAAVYTELQKLAGSYLRRERGDHTFQPTALVHEAFLKLWSDCCSSVV
jgi:RNA polymerase sigma-70 factor, ECF subfamily